MIHDLDFYIDEVNALAKHGSHFCGKQQLEIIVNCLKIAYPTIIIVMEHRTIIETERKHTIEKAGLIYTRHIYPDYSGSDELFYDFPMGPEDPIHEQAKEILRSAKKQ